MQNRQAAGGILHDLGQAARLQRVSISLHSAEVPE
jgi:hypothetical protein